MTCNHLCALQRMHCGQRMQPLSAGAGRPEPARQGAAARVHALRKHGGPGRLSRLCEQVGAPAQ